MSENPNSGSDNEKGKAKRGPRKRQVHNEVERRRKDKINSWILKISELLPNKELHKKSKISILEQTVSYIKELVAERSKLLSNQLSDVQDQEVKSLKRSLRILEEKNILYSNLLQEANISLTSLPKKASKYSNKFTEEVRATLLAKLNASEPIENQCEGDLPSLSSASIVSTSGLSNTISSLTTTQGSQFNSFEGGQSVPIANNIPAVTINISDTIANGTINECSRDLVVVTASPKVSPILNIAHCRVGNASMLNAGGVTSALPSLPVMSSTLGSSLASIHNKSMQLILLPNGLLQPSIIPSNISLVGPSLETSFSILMTPQPHTVPISTIAVTPIPTTNKVAVVDRSSINAPVSCNSQLKSIAPKVTAEANQTTLPNLTMIVNTNGDSCPAFSGNNVPSDIREEDKRNKTINEEVRQLELDSSSSCKDVTVGPSPNVQEIPLEKTPQADESKKKKQFRNRPQSLQVLSANKIIFLASKFQMPCKSIHLAKCNSNKDMSSAGSSEVNNIPVTSDLDFEKVGRSLQQKQTSPSADDLVTANGLLEKDSVNSDGDKQQSYMIDKSTVGSVNSAEASSDKPSTIAGIGNGLVSTGEKDSLNSCDAKQSLDMPSNTVEHNADIVHSKSCEVLHNDSVSHIEEQNNLLISALSSDLQVTAAHIVEAKGVLPFISAKDAVAGKDTATPLKPVNPMFQSNMLIENSQGPQTSSPTVDLDHISKVITAGSNTSTINLTSTIDSTIILSASKGEFNSIACAAVPNQVASYNMKFGSETIPPIDKSIVESQLSVSQEKALSTVHQLKINQTIGQPWEGAIVTSTSADNINVHPVTTSDKETCYFSSSVNHNQTIQTNLMQGIQFDRVPKTKVSADSAANKLQQTKKTRTSPETLPESVSTIGNFHDYAFDVLGTANDIVSPHKCHRSSDSHQKAISSTSDILAKAAESIFGSDAFTSMEEVSVQSLSQQIDSGSPFEGTLRYSNATMDTHTSMHVPNIPENSFVNTKVASVPVSEQYIVSANRLDSSKYELAAQPSRVRKGNSNSDEPQAKKIKDHHPAIIDATQKSSCLPQDSVLPSISMDDASAVKSNFYLGTTNSSNSHMATSVANQPSIPSSAKQAQFCNVADSTNLLCLPSKFQCQAKGTLKIQNSIPDLSAGTLDIQQAFQPTTSNGCDLISHPINSLFSTASSSKEISAGKSSFLLQNDKSETIKKPSEYQKQNCPCPSEVTTTKKNHSGIPISKECITKKTIQNETNILNNSNVILQPSDNRSFYGIQHLSNSAVQSMGTQSFSSQSATLTSMTQSKFAMVNLPSSSDETVPPPLLSRNPNGRVAVSFESSIPIISNSLDDTSKNCQLPSSNNNLLSHSLCSLLKETPSNTIYGNVTSAPNNVITNSLASTTSITKSKYSALSLISNEAFIGTSSRNNNPLITSVTTASLSSGNNQDSSSTSVCRNPKSSLSYSAERLIQSQYTAQEKERCKNTSQNFGSNKKLNCTSNVQELYRSNTFVPVVSSEVSVPLPLPPVTSFPSFPSGFPMCDGRPSSSICNSGLHPYQDVATTMAKENVFPQNSIVPNVQSNSTSTQGTSFPKSNHGLTFNVENHGNIYNSCNFLQHTKPNLDIMKVSDSSSCFQNIFVNSSYPQQVQKQNYCPFIEQTSSDNSDKSFAMIPPPIPSFHSEKEVGHEHRSSLVSNMSQPSSSYLGNIFYETASCSHESTPGNKPSILRPTQDTYMPLRNKQNQNGPSGNQHKSPTLSKGKTKKSKHLASLESNLYKSSATTTYNSNTSMNFNVFTVPDLSSSKTNISHVPNNYSKSVAQPILPAIRETGNQQGKVGDSVLGSVMHTAFNHGLHQQNDNFLNLNFQPPTWNGESTLAVPPPLTLPSPCTSASKVTRSFTTGAHPVPNFNLSNILPDMGSSSNNDINISPIKFPTSVPQGHRDCHSSSVPSNAVVSVPNQSTLYSPHHSVVPNALLNPALNRNQPPMPVAGNIPPIPHATSFTPTQTPPFRNVIHSLNFSRN